MSNLIAKAGFDTWTGHFVRRIRQRYNDQCVNVIAYHSISNRPSLLTAGTMLRHSPAEFERHLNYLAEHYSPISLRALVDALATGDLPRRALVITLDDGFADSIRQAAPILARRRIPATIFPVTATIGNRDLLWQHKLTWLVSQGHEEKFFEAARGESYPIRKPGESAESFAREHYRADLPDLLESLLRRVGSSGSKLADELRPYLDEEEIAQAEPELVEFGNHTHTHAILAALAPDQLRREIVTARDLLSSLTGRPPVALAYPFGLKRHYNAESRRIAVETGHRAALDSRRRVNGHDTDPFELSRKPAPTGSQLLFEQLIEDWPADISMPARGGGA